MPSKRVRWKFSFSRTTNTEHSPTCSSLMPNKQEGHLHGNFSSSLSSSSGSLSCSYPSTSSSTAETINSNITVAKPTAIPSPCDPLEEEIVALLKSHQTSIKESGLVKLRSLTRESSERRITLCTSRLLAVLVPMLLVSSSKLQINVTASIVNLSIEPANKVKIVRAGAVPPLVRALKHPEEEEEVCSNAAGALFSLALDDENKLAIGVLGAIQPLLSLFSGSGGDVQLVLGRLEAGMALYHLSLAPNNLVKIARTPGAIKALLRVAGNMNENAADDIWRRKSRVAFMLLASLARRDEGKKALMDAGAVNSMVGMMRGKLVDDKVVAEYYCLGVMYEMSGGGMSSLRFRALANAARAEEVLRVLLDKYREGEGEGSVGKEMARKILKVIKGNVDREARRRRRMLRDEEEDDYDEKEEEEEVASIVSDGLLSFRRRLDSLSINSPSNSSNF